MRTVGLRLVFGTLIAFLGGAPSMAATSTQTVAVAADAYVSSAKPSTNYGKAMALQADASPVERVYVRFTVANTSGQVTKATLRVSAKSSSSAGVAVWSVADSSWSESTIAWSNAPPLAASATRSTGAFSSGWVAVDVTPLVTGNGTVSFAVTTATATVVNLRSREAGSATAPQLVVETQPVAAPPPPGGGDPVIAAAGDIACNTPATTSGSTCHYGATAARVTADPAITDVLTLGDNQYECGDYSNLLNFYDPTWGLFRSRTHPAIGNHEYLTAPGTAGCDPASTTAAKGYFDYWNGINVASGPAGDRAKGYYSYDVGAWHLIALNSNCAKVGGCSAGSAQETWLRNDLAAHPSACTLAYWHHPRFSSGEHGNNPAVGPLWNALYQAGADVVLNGHDHDYERFAPQTPGAVADTALGIREFVVGTGGKSHYAFTATVVQPNSEARNAATYGILKLTLHAQSYDWQFVPEAGGSFTDAGSGLCHSSNADTTPPSKPVVTATPASTSVALTWPRASDNVAVSRYDVSRGGVLAGTVAQPASGTVSFTDTGRTPSTTYSYVVTAFDGAGNSTPSDVVTATTTAGGAGGTTTLIATADAKVDASVPTTNFATVALRVDASPDVRSYVKFDASALTGTVRSATLRVWATSAQSVGFDVYGVSDSTWTETGLTYANQPASTISATKLGSSGAVAAGTWTTIDVTPRLTAPGVYSFVLETTSSTALALASREDTTHPPQLVVTTG
jgi:acid phosphatase type 7